MDLQNLIPHKKNSAVCVDGTVYQIDASGVCHDVTPDHATKLLQNADAWRVLGAPVTHADPEKNAKLEAARAARAERAAKAKAEKDADKAEKDDTSKDPPYPAGDDEAWADPDPSYSFEWLRRCATAYAIDYTLETDKAALVLAINQAMYEG